MANILVVDDESGVRTFMAEALELAEHTVDQADSGEAALERLDRVGYDVVVTDLKMPGIDGLELLAAVRERQPSAEVIVVSAHGTIDSAVEAMKRGAFDFLQKPVSGPAELQLLVERAIERRRLRAMADGARRERAERGDGPTLTWGAASMKPVVAALEKVARTDATVLLVGESGTGKEVAARAVHQWSARKDGPFVAINCAALTATLLESELFGHEKGAFTGATTQRQGRIELAAGGTFFLDEVGELEPPLQAKLLRVLQERRFERVGGHQTLAADVRWVAATNRDLGEMMREGSFREDLYHRLAVFPVKLPPLRDRRDDIGPLAEALVRIVGAELGRPGLSLTDAAKTAIVAATWPGNVRELRNALERAAILADGDQIDAEHLWLDPAVAGSASAAASATALDGSLEDLEKAAIEHALAACDGNRKAAAERLGIGVRTLYDKLKRYGIS